MNRVMTPFPAGGPAALTAQIVRKRIEQTVDGFALAAA